LTPRSEGAPDEGAALAALAVPPPVRPMLAKAMHALPAQDGAAGEGWMFEPKWDGFRTLVFRSGAELLLQSRDLKPMNRYFPELLEPLAAQLPPRCVLDGEVVVVAAGSRLDFPALQQRIHPAASRVAMLAERTPASFVAFDVLVADGADLSSAGFAARRAALEQLLAGCAPPLHLTPMTRDRAVAEDWFRRFEGAGLDGVMAKDPAGRYRPGARAMVKVKPKRTVDCVVGGLRWHKNGPGTMVGSLLLGLYDERGRLHHVGVAASFRASRRRELAAELAPLRDGVDAGHPWFGWMQAAGAGAAAGDRGEDGARGEGGPGAEDGAGRRVPDRRVPGSVSRWSQGKDQSWVPLRAERVVEVTYDHVQGGRFRHTAHFVRWRPDKDPRECTCEQLAVTPPVELSAIFRA